MKWLPYILLGPVSGPLAAGVVRHYRTAPALAALYALALGLLAYDLPHVLAALAVYVATGGRA
jgi:NhaP-type Na+/H+ and K+/H+ antiporter